MQTKFCWRIDCLKNLRKRRIWQKANILSVPKTLKMSLYLWYAYIIFYI